MENEINYLSLDDIIPNRFQPREVFDEEALNELADSIRQHGVIQPIVVRRVQDKYEIIAGERRYKASALAGLTKIPAIVKDLDDKTSSVIAYVENAQRKNVTAIEEARTCKRMLDNNNITQEELAREIGISQSNLANKLRLLSLPLEIQEALLKNEISERHARSLLVVKDQKNQLELLKKIKEKRLTVRELDSEIKNMESESNMNNIMGNNSFIPAQESPLNNNGNMFIPPINSPTPTENTNSFIFHDINKDSNQEINLPTNQNNMFINNNDLDNKPIESNDFVLPDLNIPPVVETKASSIGEMLDTGKAMEEDLVTNSPPSIDDVILNAITPPPINEEPVLDNENNDFTNLVAPTESIDDLKSIEVPEENDNVAIEPSKPEYIEQKSGYIDVSKPKTYDTIDDVINELQTSVNKVKNSKYKIETDEVNFDDVYQITIKINKREF